MANEPEGQWGYCDFCGEAHKKSEKRTKCSVCGQEGCPLCVPVNACDICVADQYYYSQ